MSSLKTTYKELAIPYFKEVFQIIDKVLREHNIPYYLIGASAMALEKLKLGSKLERATKDIDFAIMISSEDEYEEILNSLESHNFVRTNDPWRIFHKEFDILIDLLPFGKIEENDSVNFKNNNAELHVLGFAEVLDHAITVEIEEHIANIPSLHGMLILKLVSWSDRPEQRYNDPYDIFKIIKSYFLMNYNEIVEYHYDLLDENEFDELKISSRILGRNAAPILSKYDKLKERILRVLNENIQDPINSKIAEKWAIEHDETIEYAISLLKELKTGIMERIKG